MSRRRRRCFPLLWLSNDVLGMRTVRAWLVNGLGVLLLGGLATLLAVVPVEAEEDPYAADPLGLFADYDETSYYTTQPDTFEVSICDPSHLSRTLEEVVDYVNNESLLRGYWASVSNNKYALRFVAGVNGCYPEVQRRASGQWTAGFVIVAPEAGVTALPGTFGAAQDRTWGGPRSNGRFYQTLFWTSEDSTLLWDLIAALGMGITFDWPSSFTSALPESAWNYHHDNPMDVMSGAWIVTSKPPYLDNEYLLGHKIGTVAANRYAAGWIDPSDVHIYRGGTDRVVLRAGWKNGTQMLVVPSGEQGHFLTLGTRVAKRHDLNIPKEGVESYLIDQRPGASEDYQPQACPAGGTTLCVGHQRRTIPWPHTTESFRDEFGSHELVDPTLHVLTPGDEFTWNDTTIRVLRRIGDAYEVEITDGTPSVDWFTDDDGNTHEADINRIAQLGVTVGCATTPEALYCPESHVTRAQMAAFLLRAVGQPNPTITGSNPFADVADGVWYTKYTLRLAQLGIDTGEDGTWRPNDPLTRLEMAQWLTRMFDHIIPTISPQGLFDDVDQEYWALVEGLHQADVTRGCSTQPLLYCPDQAVTRAQMASFIIRALP